jgi:hypothetical protein
MNALFYYYYYYYYLREVNSQGSITASARMHTTYGTRNQTQEEQQKIHQLMLLKVKHKFQLD